MLKAEVKKGLQVKKYSYLPHGWSLDILRGFEVLKVNCFKGK